jgi:hypothetical protein
MMMRESQRRFGYGGQVRIRVLTSCLVIMAVITACSSGATSPSTGTASGSEANSQPAPIPTANTSWGSQDPTPQGFSKAHDVGEGQQKMQNDWVAVTWPAGTLPKGTKAAVSLGSPLGSTDGPFARERWGAPVKVDHSAALIRPLTLTWDVSRLSSTEQATIILVRWDEGRRVWAATSEPRTLTKGKLTAHVSHFSVIDWVSNGSAALGQTFGQWTGKRADAPKCSDAKLPSWVKSVVRPDENLSATAIRTCVEPDKDPGVIAVRVVDNRSYSQRFTLDAGGQQWDWVWNGEEDFSPLGSVWNAAHSALDSRTRVVLPPTKAMAFGISRPDQPGDVVFTMQAKSDSLTIFADLVGMTIDSMGVGGFDNPVTNAATQALFECGGRELLKARPKDANDAAGFAYQAARSCVAAIVGQGSSELSDVVMTSFETSLRKEIAKGGDSAVRAIKAGRLVHEVSSRLWVLNFFEAVEYVSNQFADAWVGPTTLTVRVSGTPQALGSWQPTCSNATKDSASLYRNVALQDQFADKGKDLWQFSGWAAAASQAVKPLANCSGVYRDLVAKDVESTWADKKAAAVVAKNLREQGAITITRTWFVHGGGLTIHSDGTAVATGHGSCGPPGDWCMDVMDLKAAQINSTTLKLTVIARYSHDTSNRRYAAPTSATAVGDYYLLVVQPDGLALTELHAPDGSLRTPRTEANNLGNPWLCPEGSTNADGRCGA